MFDFQQQMTDIETQARQRRIPIRDLCKQAGVAVSNWGRWKRGASSPTFSKWEKVEATASRLFNATSNSSPDDNSSRAAAASPDPNSETSESPPLVRGVGDPVATPAPADG